MTRRSFLLHIDSLDVLDELNNEQAGMLLKAMRDYHNDEEMQLDALTKIVFSPFKNQFNRDTLKYQTTCERRANAGSMGGKQKVANASKPKQKVAKLAENDNVSKNDNVNDNVNDSDNKSDNDNVSKKIKDLPTIVEEYVFKLLTNKTDSFYLVTTQEIDYYKSTYQAVNIEQQFKEIASWLNANQKNRKTIGGMPKFINAWLSKSQNKAPRVEIGKTQEIFNQLSEINYDRR
jgi:hypothetical protein